MILRQAYLNRLEKAVARSPITALIGPRQVGKTTLAHQFSKGYVSTVFDLESNSTVRTLENPELVLGSTSGLVVIDEVQRMPELFSVLRILADREHSETRFLILGSASPSIVKGVSESLAGRIELIDITGFDLQESGYGNLNELWCRGGFPRSFLATSNDSSIAWRKNFIRTFLERDIPQLGIRIPASALERFWHMLAHWHGQVWNASELGRSLGVGDKTMRSYLDILTGIFLIRQLQPWHANIAKRQVKAPKIYFRDSGLLHALLDIQGDQALYRHPKVGASWEGFIIEQILSCLDYPPAWFWSAHSGGEVDLLIQHNGYRLGFEVKFSESPKVSAILGKSATLIELDHLFVIYPGTRTYPVTERITVLPAVEIETLPRRLTEMNQATGKFKTTTSPLPLKPRR